MRGVLIVAMALAGCSQDAPPVVARAKGGVLVFDVPPTGKSARDCITGVAVFAEDSGLLATPELGDDREAVEAGDYWRATSAAKGQCVGNLPIRYGSASSTTVKPKPLRVGAAYTVALAEGQSEYRSGRFRITADKRVENLSNASGETPDAR